MKWIVYCSEKASYLEAMEDRKGLTFQDCILEIEKGDFLIIESPSEKHGSQKSFLLEISGYPVIVPFNQRGELVQLITLFPDRRFKNA